MKKTTCYSYLPLTLCILAHVIVCRAAMRPASSLSIMAGEGFLAYLEVPKSFGQIKNCWFKFRGDEKVKIDLSSTEAIKTERNESILPYAENICGIRVMGISAASAAVWTLQAEYELSDIEEDTITIGILPSQKTNFDTKVEMEMGKGTVKCSKLANTRHCKIFDNYYAEEHHECELYTSIHPKSIFDCYMFNWGRMEASHERIIVDIKTTSILHTNATLKESNESAILNCEFQDKVFTCQAMKPANKNELMIMDGVYNAYYSAYDTITSKSKCSLEVPKPFKPEDIGLWRILNYESTPPSGCLFYIGKSKEDIILDAISKSSETKVIKLYAPEGTSDNTIDEISCSVPFIIYDCFLRDPNHTVYFPDSIRFGRQRMYGKCSFYGMPVIAGTWSCGVRGKDYDREVVQNIEVEVKSKYGETLTNTVSGKRGDTVELMCKSPFEEPISHCAFVDPRGIVHLVASANSLKSKGHVQYYGRGINEGECGIKIFDIDRDDFGSWKCDFIIYSITKQSTFTMQLKESETAHATSVGMGVGITIMIVLVLGVVLGTVFYRRKNLSARRDFTAASTDTLELPSSSVSHS